MASYILRRLLQVIPVFFGATLLIYFMVFAMPGDPILALFGETGKRAYRRTDTEELQQSKNKGHPLDGSKEKTIGTQTQGAL